MVATVSSACDGTKAVAAARAALGFEPGKLQNQWNHNDMGFQMGDHNFLPYRICSFNRIFFLQQDIILLRISQTTKGYTFFSVCF